jgi:hypothetical protein
MVTVSTLNFYSPKFVSFLSIGTTNDRSDSTTRDYTCWTKESTNSRQTCSTPDGALVGFLRLLLDIVWSENLYDVSLRKVGIAVRTGELVNEIVAHLFKSSINIAHGNQW